MVQYKLAVFGFCAALVPALSGQAFAQDPTVPKAPTANVPTNAAPPSVMPGSAPPMGRVFKADPVSRRFIDQAIEGNLAEIALGKLAQSKSTNDGVKSYGAMLVADHTQANEKAIEAARAAGVQPPTHMSAQQRRTYNRMARLSSSQFDSQFVKHMVADHRKDIRDYERHESAKSDRIIRQDVATNASQTSRSSCGTEPLPEWTAIVLIIWV